jgi:hypothetical protein
MLGVRGYERGRVGIGSVASDPRAARIRRERGWVPRSDLQAQAIQSMERATYWGFNVTAYGYSGQESTHPSC